MMITDLLSQALAIPAGSKREAWMAAACGGDPDVWDELQQLLLMKETARPCCSQTGCPEPPAKPVVSPSRC